MNEKDIAVEKEIAEKGADVAPRVTLEKRESVIKDVKFLRPTGTLTICIMTLLNGTTLVGESACVSEENFNQELGEKYARENAERKIWPLEGYLLKQRMYEASLAEQAPRQRPQGEDCEGPDAPA